MYYKLTENGTVTDVIERESFVRYQDKHGMIVPCGAEYANGIRGKDSTIYHVEGLPAFPQGSFATVTEIGRAEYLTLADRLGRTVEPLPEDAQIALERAAHNEARTDYLAMMLDVDLDGDLV